MITRVLSTGLLAGLVAGLAIATLQNFTTTPLVIAAEVYENAAEEPASATGARFGDGGAHVVLIHAPAEGHGSASEDAGDEWAPGGGAERILFTSIATIATAVGFALLLIGGMLASGDTIDERGAIAWASAAFLATGLAPGAGLPPELPGMQGADLVARQAWWFLTASLTGLSLWLFLRSPHMGLRPGAVLLLLAPHILGAPHVHELGASRVPAELAARFAALSLAVQAALWVTVGVAVGVLWPRLARAGGVEAAALR